MESLPPEMLEDRSEESGSEDSDDGEDSSAGDESEASR